MNAPIAAHIGPELDTASITKASSPKLIHFQAAAPEAVFPSLFQAAQAKQTASTAPVNSSNLENSQRAQAATRPSATGADPLAEDSATSPAPPRDHLPLSSPSAAALNPVGAPTASTATAQKSSSRISPETVDKKTKAESVSGAPTPGATELQLPPPPPGQQPAAAMASTAGTQGALEILYNSKAPLHYDIALADGTQGTEGQAMRSANSPEINRDVSGGADAPLSSQFSVQQQEPMHPQLDSGELAETAQLPMISERKLPLQPAVIAAKPELIAGISGSVAVAKSDTSATDRVAAASSGGASASSTVAHDSPAGAAQTDTSQGANPGFNSVASSHLAAGAVPISTHGTPAPAPSGSHDPAGAQPGFDLSLRVVPANAAQGSTNPHAILDSAAGSGTDRNAVWQLTPNRVEAGFANAQNSWVSVVVQRQDGHLTAALSSGSAAERFTLQSLLPQLTTHLADRQLQVNQVAVSPRELSSGTDSGNLNQGNPNQGNPNQGHRNQDLEPQKQSSQAPALSPAPIGVGEITVESDSGRISLRA
jgi:hypothetical protein